MPYLDCYVNYFNSGNYLSRIYLKIHFHSLLWPLWSWKLFTNVWIINYEQIFQLFVRSVLAPFITDEREKRCTCAVRLMPFPMGNRRSNKHFPEKKDQIVVWMGGGIEIPVKGRRWERKTIPHGDSQCSFSGSFFGQAKKEHRFYIVV